jgi:hypothetical protein
MVLSSARAWFLPLQGGSQEGDGLQQRDQTHPHPNPGVSASLRRSAGAERYSAKPLLHPLEGEGVAAAVLYSSSSN